MGCSRSLRSFFGGHGVGRWAGPLLLTLAAALPAPAAEREAAPGALPRTLWLVSSRHLAAPGAGELEVWRHGEGRWLRSDVERLLAWDRADTPTVVYVHGNLESAGDVQVRAPVVFERLAQAAAPGQPFRLIVFSWPSAKAIDGIRRDAQLKATRAELHALHLAGLLTRIRPDVRTSLYGFSFGARMITSSLHLLGGGAIYGHTLPASSRGPRSQPRVVLMAAALDQHWLYPGHHHGQAFATAERITNLRSCCDKALKWYPMMCPGGGPEALGYAGLNPWALGPYQDQYRQIEVSGLIGCEHDWCLYAGNPNIVARIAEDLLGPAAK